MSECAFCEYVANSDDELVVHASTAHPEKLRRAEPVSERPVSPATTAREWDEPMALRQIRDSFVMHNPGDMFEVTFTEMEELLEWAKAIRMTVIGLEPETDASSQSEKLVGIGQEAAEKIADEVVRMLRDEKKSGYNTAKSFQAKFKPIIDKLVAERLAK